MIKLVLSARKRDQLTYIEGVPEAALEIVKKHEPLFDEASVLYEDGTWAEYSDLSLAKAERLRDELIQAGFECEIVDNPYKSN